MIRTALLAFLFASLTLIFCNAQTSLPGTAANYTLGTDDQVTIRALDVEELDGKVARIDTQGNIDVPLLGTVKASGLTVQQLEAKLSEQLARYVQNPRVTVVVSEVKSQPVSILGAVTNPGTYDLTGPSTLTQVLSKAGGLKPDAGNTIYVTRNRLLGTIPLASAQLDNTGTFYRAEITVKSLLDANNPRDNIVILPKDVISIPRAELVYVVGAVNRPGGFVLTERSEMSVLQAVSLAQGLEKMSAPKSAKIIRRGLEHDRTEVPVNVAKILDGKSPDMPLQANDILFIPGSTAKRAALRALEAALQAGTFAGGYTVVR
jgi:polysaccharide biosynthesis/export protein